MTMLPTAATPQRTSFDAIINSRRIFIEVDGQGPYMIMTHGLGTSTNVFQPLMEIYSNRFTVVRFDWPGLGRSGLVEGQKPLSVPGFLEDLEGVMQCLKIETAVLVGHSLGGIISMHFAAKSPERVRGLVVLGAGRTRAEESPARTATLAQAKTAREVGMQVIVDQRVTFNIPLEGPALARALLRQVTATTNPEGYAQVCEALCDSSHIDPDYARISCPTYIIGGKHDQISPCEIAMDLQAQISKGGNAPDLCILDTGHMHIIEDVCGVAQAIDKVVAKPFSSW
ncbi:Alpha/Beta hydrolase protein [Aspergillus bertholletiae]|uniref:Alpha/Beta hydrolase protein n=1 Tax=Aspergillus bertholletiae TaxID=1226010 RepID=A0A5N7B7C9_9EURO|nr:Alpha/Beta hydrolase protein [Aspergillus bertholletiae]